jgi:hypothetical protein
MTGLDFAVAADFQSAELAQRPIENRPPQAHAPAKSCTAN